MLFQTFAAGLLLSASLSSAAVVVPKKSRFKFFEMPDEFSGPCDLTPGPDGAIWIQDILAPKIARIDTDTEKVTSYDIPYKESILPTSGLPLFNGKTPLACAIQPGADGMMYATSGIRGEFVRINTKTKKIKVFKAPTSFGGNLQPFNDLYRAEKGMYLTQSTANVIHRFNYKTHKFDQTFDIPTPESLPLGLYVTPDGAVWFAEFGLQKIGRLNTTTGEFAEYPVPLPGLAAPAVIRAYEAPYLYFTAAGGNAIGRINTNNGQFKRYGAALPLRVPGTDIEDGKGNVWFSSFSSNVLGRLNPKTGKVVAVRTPNVKGSGLGVEPVIPLLTISVTYGKPNSIYYSQTSSNFVGRLKLRD